MADFLATTIYAALTVGDLAAILGVLLAGSFIAWVVGRLIARRAAKLTEATEESWRGAVLDAFDGPLRLSIFVTAVWVAYLMLTGQAVVKGLQSTTFMATQLPFAMWFGVRLARGWTAIWSQRAEETEGTFDDQLVPVVRTLATLSIVILGIVLFLQNMGYAVGSLLAGLGIGGAAIALASKDTIANLFGSIVIFVDRPFQVGDWVEIGAQEGTVEAVGLRVTRIRTFANSLITVPNSQLTTTAINNWSRMRKRRIKLTIGLTYDASPAQIQAAVRAIREVLDTDERISQDFKLVNFTNFGASSLDIFVYAFTLTTRWDEYMQIREDILLEFMRRIEALGLSFAFPSQSIYVESLPEPTQAPESMGRQLPL